ncbi:MAG: hypothetical protein QM765_29865 [Myxococcales bacterium]
MRLIPCLAALSLLTGCTLFDEDLVWPTDAHGLVEDGGASDAAVSPSDAASDAAISFADAASPGTDAGGAPDASSGSPDVGVPTDASHVAPDASGGAVETTIPVINDRGAGGHAAFATSPNNLVHFKGVVVSPVFTDSKDTTSADPAYWFCRTGVYLADQNGGGAHNGILLTTRGSVTPPDAGSLCRRDSPLERIQAGGDAGLEIGEELEVTGLYLEDCRRSNADGGCDYVDTDGKEALAGDGVGLPGELHRPHEPQPGSAGRSSGHGRD